MKKGKILRGILAVLLFGVVISAVSMVLYMVKIPYLSPDNLFTSTSIAVLAAIFATSKKVKAFVSGEAANA